MSRKKPPSDTEVNAFIAEKICGWKWRVFDNEIYLVSISLNKEYWGRPRKNFKKAKCCYSFVPNYVDNVPSVFNAIEHLKKTRPRFHIDIFSYENNGKYKVVAWESGSFHYEDVSYSVTNQSLPRAVCLALYGLYHNVSL